MKKFWIAITAAVLIAVVGLLGFWLVNHRESLQEPDEVERFALSDEMYGQGVFEEITAEEFNRLVVEKKSFIVVVHMVVCPAEFPVTSIAKQLARDDAIVIYGLTEEEFKRTDLAGVIKYLPSVAVYHDGKMVAYLDAEADEDTRYYKTAEGLKQWLGRYLTASL